LKRRLTIDTELNPAAGEWAVFAEGAPGAQSLSLRGRRGALAAFIAGPEAFYMTGASLTVDGGTSA
jgi:3-oxoacyl-[acyl-carrier protein] reductase